jgi:hypothetical protein
MYVLSAVQQEELLAQPESGMGFQFVEFETVFHERKLGVAYNAELVATASERADVDAFRAYRQARELFASRRDHRILRLRVVPRDLPEIREKFSVLESPAAYGRFRGPARDAPLAATSPGEIFLRFSAFEDDHRINVDGSLKPGSYATTEEDARHVRTGKDVVARQALPNPDPAVNVFKILPPPRTPIQCGIVASAHHHPGGGVEVIFPQGTPAASVTGPAKIPPR